MARTKPFDEHLSEYEQWFKDHYSVYLSELSAIARVLPSTGKGVEIGVGSGLFAGELGIREGIDPSPAMCEKALERNIEVVKGVAEDLPYPDAVYDYALMVTAICFVDDIAGSFREVHRILKKNGVFVIGFVDKNSPVGKIYQKHKDQSLFYKDADFFSTEEVLDYLSGNGFQTSEIWQTVFGTLDSIREVQPQKPGYGEGSFVVIKAISCEKDRKK
jgi:SAM-dependent methyltransferase